MVGCTGLESTLQLFNQISHRRGLTWLNKQLVGTLWFYGRMDVTLMGRRTFAEVAKLDGPALAYPTTENFVFTHNALDCQGFTAVAEDPAEFVEKLGSDRNIWVVGGNTVLKPLLERDMGSSSRRSATTASSPSWCTRDSPRCSCSHQCHPQARAPPV